MPYIADAHTDATPVAAAYHGALYVAYKDASSPTLRVAYTRTPEDDGSWHVSDLTHVSFETAEPHVLRPTTAPGLTSVGDESLVLAFKGHDNPRIWMVSMRESSWRASGFLPNAETAESPFLNGAMVVHRGNRDHGVWTKFLETPGGEVRIPDASTLTTPVAAVRHDDGWEENIIVFRAEHDDSLMFTSRRPGPAGWTAPQPIRDEGLEHRVARSRCRAGIAEHGGLLYVAYKRVDDDEIEIASFDGRFWTIHGTVGGQFTGQGPSLVSFQDRLMVVCRGHNNDLVWYREVPLGQYVRVAELPFRPDPHGFSFANFAEGDPDWSTFRATFGHAEVDGAAALAVLGRLSPVPQHRADSLLFWSFYGVYKSMCDGTWNTGMCTAYTARSLYRHYRQPAARTFDEFPAVSAASELPGGIRRELTIAHGRLLGYEVLENLIDQCARGIANVRTCFDAVEHEILGGSSLEGARFLVFIPAGRVWDAGFIERIAGTHAVVPYRIEYPTPGSSDPIRMRVYDSNHPGNNSSTNPGTSVIEFTRRSDGALDFQYRPAGTGSGADFDSRDGWTLGSLTVRDFVLNDIRLPLNGNIVDLILSPADLQIRNRRGQLTGRKDGKICFEIPGSFPMLPCPDAFVLPVDDYSRELHGTGSGPYTFCSMYPDGTVILLQGQAEGGAHRSMDRFEFDRVRRKLTLSTLEGDRRCACAVRTADAQGVRIVKMSGIRVDRGRPFALSFTPTLDQLTSEQKGASEDVGVVVQQLPASGGPAIEGTVRIPLQSQTPLQIRLTFGDRIHIAS